ncbi:aminopeptidase N [Agaribacter flavus]|uniref:Aminopeptidase N n=1 Tax=Agaribacter flavus TaxID=1902781 RepID=A0ABV7FMX2_9ALTE
MTEHLIKRRLDYQQPDFSIRSTFLTFDLSPSKTVVTSCLHIKKENINATQLKLDGENLLLLSVSVNGRSLGEYEYQFDEYSLSLNIDEENVELEITTQIDPQSNTSLEGLYYTQSTYCTQCEAEGFRKISYYLDRPDVLSVFTVTIRSKCETDKFLLSNGNLVKRYQDGDTAIAVWHDPHPKPSYLFALVAGDFDLLTDSYSTLSGRQINLELYLEKGRLKQGQHALDSLKKAMRWDEETYGLEYDLAVYMVVAVDFFNMGAMENKGLNVFNSKFVLADPQTATDEDYFNIESIIAHEYFHNWTGNRVTCRDWFQLSLKEGLTVFRDQQFSADMSSYLSTRIAQVKVIREHQFVEDAGPMSHPIRPDEVMEMNNFYTVTVYDKGAEVIRMLHTLLTKEGFRKGMDLYFARHDGQAVTCDDFVDAMASANNVDLRHFQLWYSQSGTPLIKVRKVGSENKGKSTTFEFTQINAATPDQANKKPLFVPISTKFLDESGQEIKVSSLNNGNIIVDRDKVSVTVESENVTPVLLDNFSAPIIVEYDYAIDELLHIIQYADSSYAKWDASQGLFIKCIQTCYLEDFDSLTQRETKAVLAKYANVLKSNSIESDVLAQLLSVPSFEAARVGLESIDPIRFDAAIQAVQQAFADELGEYALLRCQDFIQSEYEYSTEQVNARAIYAAWLKLASLSEQGKNAALVTLRKRYANADNMSDKLNCLKVAQATNIAVFDELMLKFESEYTHDAVIMDKWFSLHATARRSDILSRLDLLKAHSQFNQRNPNKVRALLGSFAFYNLSGFHQKDGLGYKYVADYLLQLDKINPQVASRIITPLLQFKQYDASYKAHMKHQLERIFNSKELSKDLFEKTSKALASDT